MSKFIQTILSIFCILFSINVHAQIINIPDANFKAKLLQSTTGNYITSDSLLNSIKIDINNDGEIQQNEALRVFYLDVNSSSISNLTGVEYFTNLRMLRCENNTILNLNLSALVNLNTLYCYQNQLTSLNVSALTKLTELRCQSNQISTLNTNGLTGLTGLQCNNNRLTSLTVSESVNLTTLFCFDNLLTDLDVSSLIKLRNLRCQNNLLTSLDITMLKDINTLYCSGSALKSLYLKNGINNTSSDFDFFYLTPVLSYICADSSEISAFKVRAINAGKPNIIINSFCSSTLNGSFYNLKSIAKVDTDTNGCTNLDINYKNLRVFISNGIDSGYIIANEQSNFAMLLDSGRYTFRPQFSNNYFTVSPISTTINLPEDTIPQQFCIIPNGTHHDVSVNIIPIQDARPGFSDATYKIVLKNKGNQIENGVIRFTYDENRQDYISATTTPNNIASGELKFNFNNLLLFETREIVVTLRTNAPFNIPAVNVDDVLLLSVNAATINVDENLADNTQQLHQTVVGSFDPNDKTCLEGNTATTDIIGNFVNYLIRFENTGTANAENVVVTDFIDLARFDVSTLELISTSHACKTLISNGNKVQFIFDNIKLPFTEPLKHGYVAFKIKTKSNLVIGDSLKNSADIYFDYNLPIKTNTAATRIGNIILSTKNSTIKTGSLSIFPNPSMGNFTINFESKGSFPIMLKLTDVKGSVAFEKPLNHSEKSTFFVDEKNLSNGIYLINITSEKENWMQKVMIVK
ncbi:MAG TPA: T9SS type A sorting domain-containing protein [Chitinophagales bacterium]|nr:T9SS type A sorting domain-containing protein [Chitinophagales bacterium]